MSFDLLVLAAGLGRRLGQRTAALPKALLPVRDRALLDYVLGQAAGLDWIGRVVVVTGYCREAMLEHLGRTDVGKPTIEVHNPDFEKGNLYSLVAGLEHVGDQWLLTNVDHIYPRRLLGQIGPLAAGVGAVCDHDRPLTPDCMKVRSRVDDAGVERVVEIDKRLPTWSWGYIGMTLVTRESRAAYMAAAETVRGRGDPGAWAEQVLGELASRAAADNPNLAPRIVDASGFGWLEIDDERDLRAATETLERDPAFLD